MIPRPISPVLSVAAAAVLLLAPVAAPALAQSGGSLSAAQQGRTTTAPQSFSALAGRLMPAVVNISTSQTVISRVPTFPEGSPAERFNEFFGRNDDGLQRQGSLGSGFVISQDGYIITNTHVIEQADTIEVTFSDARTLTAEIVGRDRDTDIAVLKVVSRTPLAYVELADSDKAEVGDWVIAIGNPLGFGGSVSAGIISATGRDLNTGRSDNFIQTDAAINQGNSGGPLFNLSGQVIGVNTAIISQSGGSIGLGFSVPSNTVRRISQQLIRDGRVRRPWLGINVQDADESLMKAFRASGKGGAIVTRVNEDSPAARARLEVGDLILAIDGRAVSGLRELNLSLSEKPIGKPVLLSVIRNGRAREISVTVEELKQDDGPEQVTPPETAGMSNDLGVDLSGLDDDVRRRYGITADMRGVVVTSVSTRGRSYNKLRRGDVITELNFQAVGSVPDLLSRVSQAMGNPAQPLLVRVKRRGESGAWFDRFVSIEIRR